MAGKNINFGAIDITYVNTFSVWNENRVSLEAIENTEGETVKAFAKLVNSMDKFGTITAVDDRLPDDGEREITFTEASYQLERMQETYRKHCAPFKEAMKKAESKIPGVAYDAYILAVYGNNGADSIGRYEKRGKGRNVEVFTVENEERTFRACCAAMLTALGIKNTKKDTFNKFVESFMLKVSGTKAASGSKTGMLYTALKENQFKAQVVRVLIQDYVLNHKAFDVSDNGAITLHDFSADNAETTETTEKN